MPESSNGKLVVQASTFASRGGRLGLINRAAEKMAELLEFDVELSPMQAGFPSIYIYFKEGEEEPIPIFCDSRRELDVDDVFRTLKNMFFVLSFHPKHQALKRIRKEIMAPS